MFSTHTFRMYMEVFHILGLRAYSHPLFSHNTTHQCSLNGPLLLDEEGEDGMGPGGLGIHVGAADSAGESSSLEARQGLG